ncbi:hypothetical protein J3Q64DRAFT_1702985 [Phycomyces blakesleeanus]|uniref:Uncharacterized protein n=1 Tax=Phycomyces blakesleeanus TaxID=4837 RepID=A0ABR3ALN2_PHYBL
MNNISENINLSTVRSVVCEELSDIQASVAKIVATVTSQQQLVREDISHSFHAGKQSATQARMSYLVNHPDDREKQQGTDVNVSAEEQKLIRLQFHMYTRQCQRIMCEDGIFALHEYRGQWAAALFLQEVMNAGPQTDKRQIAKLSGEVQEEELSYI